MEAVARERFDLVPMDVQMPEMDGFEAAMAIRAFERRVAAESTGQSATGGFGGRRLPIVAMTAFAMAEDRERCLEAGMDDFVAKPIRPEELFACIERL